MKDKKWVLIPLLVCVAVAAIYGTYYVNYYTPLDIRNDGNVILVKNTLLGNLMWGAKSPALDVTSLSLMGDVYKGSYDIFIDVPGIESAHANVLARVLSMSMFPGDLTIWMSRWIGEGYEVLNTYPGGQLDDWVNLLNDNIKGTSYAKFMLTIIIFGSVIGLVAGAFIRVAHRKWVRSLKESRGQRLTYKALLGETVSAADFISVIVCTIVGIATLLAFLDNPSFLTFLVTGAVMFGIWGVLKTWSPFRLADIKSRQAIPKRTFFFRDVIINRKHIMGVIVVEGVLVLLVYTIGGVALETALIISSVYLLVLFAILYVEERKVPSGRFRMPVLPKMKKAPSRQVYLDPHGPAYKDKMKRYYAESVKLDNEARYRKTGAKPEISYGEGPSSTNWGMFEGIKGIFDDEPKPPHVYPQRPYPGQKGQSTQPQDNTWRPRDADGRKTWDGQDVDYDKAWARFLKTKKGGMKLKENLSKKEEEKIKNEFMRYLMKSKWYGVDTSDLLPEKHHPDFNANLGGRKTKPRVFKQTYSSILASIKDRATDSEDKKEAERLLRKIKSLNFNGVNIEDIMDQQDILNNLGKDEKVLVGLMDKYQGKIPKGTIELKDEDGQMQKKRQDLKKTCPNCGAKIPVESKKCSNCGHTKSFEESKGKITVQEFKDKIKSKFGKATRGIDTNADLFEITQSDFADGKEIEMLLNHNFNYSYKSDGKVLETGKGDVLRTITLKDGRVVNVDGKKIFDIKNNNLVWTTNKGKEYSIPIKDIGKIRVYNYGPQQSKTLDMFARKKKQKPDKSKPVHPRAGKKICPACHKVTVFYQDGDLMRCDRCKKTFRRKRL